jgi:glyceraldehyde-3-phosphate dehydrogenase (NADP+)
MLLSERQELLQSSRRTLLGVAVTDVQKPWPIFVAGSWLSSDELLNVTRPGDGRLVASTYLAGVEHYEAAIVGGLAARAELRRMPAYERSRILREVASSIASDRDFLAAILSAEAGKPIKDAYTEIDRGALTFRIAAEESERWGGELMPLDLNRASEGRFGITRRFPVDLVAGISPFNLPLGLAAHKVAPAMAVGAPIVLKVPSAAPLTMLAVARYIEAAGAPAGSVSVMPMSRPMGDRMVTDDRFSLLSFTGSPSVGWDMKARAGKKRVVLELGGNAGALVDAWADLEWAAQRCVQGAFKYAGQTCISVQRVLVHKDAWEPFVERFVAHASKLVVGDPGDPATDLGPMVDEAAAQRIESWVDEAVAEGARVLVGGRRSGAYYEPTVLVDVPDSARVCREEAFAPVVVLAPVEDFEAGLRGINDSSFGLQAGVFTRDVWSSWRAFEALDVGGVILNDAPTYRVDHMPYGGVKDSGLGREGVRYAMEDMSEIRILVVAPPQ